MSDTWIPSLLPGEPGELQPVKVHHHKYMMCIYPSLKGHYELLLIQPPLADLGLLLGARDHRGPTWTLQAHPQEGLLRPGLWPGCHISGQLTACSTALSFPWPLWSDLSFGLLTGIDCFSKTVQFPQPRRRRSCWCSVGQADEPAAGSFSSLPFLSRAWVELPYNSAPSSARRISHFLRVFGCQTLLFPACERKTTVPSTCTSTQPNHALDLDVETHLWIFVQFLQLYRAASDEASVLPPDAGLRLPRCSAYVSLGLILRKKDLGFGFLVW